jgi:hypothetical protein
VLNLEPLERLGRIVTTPNAKAKVSRKDIATALQRHLRSVCGNASGGARRHGKQTPLEGCRMLTAYCTTNGTRFWIISESGQALTRVMLPEDY